MQSYSSQVTRNFLVHLPQSQYWTFSMMTLNHWKRRRKVRCWNSCVGLTSFT